MTQDAGVTKVAELIKDARIAMLTTVENNGKLISRPMAVQEVEFDGDLWFFTDEGSRKVEDVATNPQANVTFSTRDSWVSLTGTVETIKDTEKAKELWNAALDAWFPDGPETPDMVMLKVHAESAEYWDSPGGRVATLFSFVKAKATGERYDGGENEKVVL